MHAGRLRLGGAGVKNCIAACDSILGGCFVSPDPSLGKHASVLPAKSSGAYGIASKQLNGADQRHLTVSDGKQFSELLNTMLTSSPARRAGRIDSRPSACLPSVSDHPMEAMMILRDFMSETTEDGKQIFRVQARVSDHVDRGEQTEWIEFRFSIDVPTVRNGAILRREALEKAREILAQLARDFERLGDQGHS